VRYRGEKNWSTEKRYACRSVEIRRISTPCKKKNCVCTEQSEMRRRRLPMPFPKPRAGERRRHIFITPDTITPYNPRCIMPPSPLHSPNPAPNGQTAQTNKLEAPGRSGGEGSTRGLREMAGDLGPIWQYRFPDSLTYVWIRFNVGPTLFADPHSLETRSCGGRWVRMNIRPRADAEAH
jgi:hypothetical protein